MCVRVCVYMWYNYMHVCMVSKCCVCACVYMWYNYIHVCMVSKCVYVCVDYDQRETLCVKKLLFIVGINAKIKP